MGRIIFYQKLRTEVKKEDGIQEYKYTKKYAVTGLDINTMYVLAKKIREEINSRPTWEQIQEIEQLKKNGLYKESSKKWSFGFGRGKKTLICSEFTFMLLASSGLKNIMPYFANIFDPRHLLLLSLRPTLTIAALSPIFYYFLTLEHPSSWSTTLIGMIFYLLQMIIASLSEYFCLKNSRKLVEICDANRIVKSIAIFGFGIGSLISRFICVNMSFKANHFIKFGSDLGIWFGTSIGIYILFGIISSIIVYPIYGLRFYIRPTGILYLMEYLESIKDLDPLTRNIHFSQEASQLVMVIISMLGSYCFWHENDNPLTTSLLGPLIFITAGCILTLIINKIINTLSYEKTTPSLKAKELIESHQSKPIQFAIISYCTVLGIITSTYFSKKHIYDDIILNGMMSVLGTFFGYIMGACLYNIGKSAYENYIQPFFNMTFFHKLDENQNDSYYVNLPSSDL